MLACMASAAVSREMTASSHRYRRTSASVHRRQTASRSSSRYGRWRRRALRIAAVLAIGAICHTGVFPVTRPPPTIVDASPLLIVVNPAALRGEAATGFAALRTALPACAAIRETAGDGRDAA